MKKSLLLLFTVFWAVTPLLAQNNKQQPKQKRRKTPYVYKTDYEAKMKEVDGKVNAALGTAGTLRKEVNEKLDKVEELDAKMMQVEEVLSSANFKISLTSDSLSKTRFSVKEFKAETDESLEALHNNAEEQTKLIWTAAGIAFLLSLILFFVLSRLLGRLRKDTNKQTTMLYDKLKEENETQNQKFSDEMRDNKIRLTNDINRLKDEVKTSNESTTSSLAEIAQRLDAMNK
jgi:uncharacterized membrane-anchored protein YhcB (DUF1043 family)